MSLDATRFLAIARKEWIQLRRDNRSMVLAFILPLFLLVLFGYAITWDVDNLPLAVLDRDQSPTSRSLVESLEATGYFSVVEYLSSDAQVADRLTRGTAIAGLVIPDGFARDLAAGGGSLRPCG